MKSFERFPHEDESNSSSEYALQGVFLLKYWVIAICMRSFLFCLFLSLQAFTKSLFGWYVRTLFRSTRLNDAVSLTARVTTIRRGLSDEPSDHPANSYPAAGAASSRAVFPYPYSPDPDTMPVLSVSGDASTANSAAYIFGPKTATGNFDFFVLNILWYSYFFRNVFLGK